jgi:CRP-like cAMP-binding protein
MNQPTRQFKNRILASLPKAELDLLTRHLSPVDLPQGKMLLDGDVKRGYFIEDGVASVVITLNDGATVEVGVIGFDGFIGFPISLGTGAPPGQTFMQVAGSGFQIEARTLKEAFERCADLRRNLQRYIQGYLAQAAQTAACNRLHGIDERLARWLLSCRDRTESDELSLTHEFLGQMLGAPRTTVTLTAGLLQRAGFIHYSRGVVTIRDRAALERSACECYRVVRDEFERLGLL